jgi:hypothetical protein
MLFSGPKNRYLTSLREEFRLEELTVGLSSDLERLLSLLSWTNSRWLHDGVREPAASDAVSILREAATGKGFRCVEYAIVLAQALCSVGLVARKLNLMTRDVETRTAEAGHAVCEVYLESYGKWVFADPQADVVAFVDGIPLGTTELRDAILAGRTIRFRNHNEDSESPGYLQWIAGYLYFYAVEMDNTVKDGDRSLAAIRVGPPGSTEPRLFQGEDRLMAARFTTDESEIYAGARLIEP